MSQISRRSVTKGAAWAAPVVAVVAPAVAYAASGDLRAVSVTVHLVGQSATNHGFTFTLNQAAGPNCQLTITSVSGSGVSGPGVSWDRGDTNKDITRNHTSVTLGAWKHNPNINNTVTIIGYVTCGNGQPQGFTLTTVDGLHPTLFTSDTPATSEAPAIPDTPATSDTPATPNTPATSGATAIPDTPATSDTPATPNTPATSGATAIPDAPATSDTPATPNTPATSDAPAQS